MNRTVRELRVSVHEAGHAVADVRHRIPVKFVSIEPKGQSQGRAVGHLAAIKRLERMVDSTSPRSREYCEAFILGALAGMAAEAHGAGHADWRYVRASARGDHDSAMDILWRICGGEREIPLYLALLEERARTFVRQPFNWSAIEAVAAELRQHRRLAGERVREIVKQSDQLAAHRARRK